MELADPLPRLATAASITNAIVRLSRTSSASKTSSILRKRLTLHPSRLASTASSRARSRTTSTTFGESAMTSVLFFHHCELYSHKEPYAAGGFRLTSLAISPTSDLGSKLANGSLAAASSPPSSLRLLPRTLAPRPRPRRPDRPRPSRASRARNPLRRRPCAARAMRAATSGATTSATLPISTGPTSRSKTTNATCRGRLS